MILAQAFVRGALVFVIAGLLTVVLQRRSAALRHHIWASALVIQLAIIAFIPVLPTMTLPIVPTITAFTDSPVEVSSPTSVSSPNLPEPAASQQRVTDEPTDWKKVAFYVWAIGASLIFLRYLIGTLLMARIAQRGKRVDDGEWLSLAQRVAKELEITRPVTLLWGDKLAVPITWGVFYPMVLLPESAAEWPAERRRFVLVHEFAHIKRFDALTQLVAQITLAVFWFSPFVWLSEWRLRVEREHACDDVVIRHGTEPSVYADELLQMVRSLVSRKTARPAFAALAMARKSEFEGRMLAILDSTRPRSASTITSSALFILVSLLIAAPVAAIDPFAVRVVLPAAPAKAGAGPECDLKTSGTSVQVNVDGDKNTRGYVKLARPGHCIIASINGQVKFNDDETDVRELGANSFVALHEITDSNDIDVRIEPKGTGIHTTITNTGAMNMNDTALHQWIARVLPRVVAEMSIDTQERVERWLSAHQLKGTLETIARIGSPSARADHYIEVTRARRWSSAELDQIGRAVQKDLDGSNMRRVLDQMPWTRLEKSSDWLEQGLMSIESDGDLSSTLTSHLANSTKPKLLVLVRVSKKMESSYEKSAFLTAAAPCMLTPRDTELRSAWFDAVETISSSYDRSNSLLAATRFAYGNAPLRDRIGEAATRLGKAERTNVLTALAQVR